MVARMTIQQPSLESLEDHVSVAFLLSSVAVDVIYLLLMILCCATAPCEGSRALGRTSDGDGPPASNAGDASPRG